jgi:hypothetical protein
MGGLQLVSEAHLEHYLHELNQLVLGCCPVEDRDLLAKKLAQLGMSKTELAAPVSLIHRPVVPAEQQGEAQESWAPVPVDIRTIERRLSILWQRLGDESRESAPESAPNSERREELVSHVIAATASKAHSDRELRELLEKLKQLGIKSGTDQIFRSLSGSLPGWAVPIHRGAAEGASPVRENAAIEAMRQILRLAENRWEKGKRLQTMIEAAIEQFNTGSLARAATMFDLAESMVSESKLNVEDVSIIRRATHGSLDPGRLRAFAEESDKHHLLQKVLCFFDEYKVQGLLDKLQGETRRDRRRLILSLLEAHGAAARKETLARLENLPRDADVAPDWYFPRNLIVLLHSIPRPDDEAPEHEIDVVAPFASVSLPAPLVKEAIQDLGQIKHTRAEQLLIAAADELERLLLDTEMAEKARSRLKSLLDRVISILAHYGTPQANKKVLDHGLSRYDELGDTVSRLSYFSGLDLSADGESVARLVETIKSSLPRKVLGVVIQKRESVLVHLIKALSATPAASVQQVFESVVERFPGAEFGKAAAKALEDLDAAGKRAQAPTERLIGDLELFGLPDLLQQLARLQLTGTLTIKDAKGELVGTIVLSQGRLASSSAGHIQGEAAVYQLLERPKARTFVFLGRRGPGGPEPDVEGSLPDLMAISFEGMRRHDELQRASALVPDSVPLALTGKAPVPHRVEEDIGFFEQVWQRASTGATAEQCEADLATDAYRVRSLLARWVEEGILNLG